MQCQKKASRRPPSVERKETLSDEEGKGYAFLNLTEKGEFAGVVALDSFGWRLCAEYLLTMEGRHRKVWVSGEKEKRDN